MAFKLKYQSGAPIIVTLNVPTSTTVLKDQLLALDVTNDGVIPATSGSTAATVLAVAQEAVTTTSAVSRVRAILIESAQIWQGDCTNSTAANQECNRHKLTSGVAVANTSTDYTTTDAMCLMLRRVGAASDKLAEFKILAINQVAV